VDNLPALTPILNKKKPRISPGLFIKFYAMFDLSPGNVSRLKTFRAFYDFERYAVALGEGFEAVAGDSGKMYEYVFAVFLLKKAKPLAVVKPFHSSVYHLLTSPILLLVGFIRDRPRMRHHISFSSSMSIL
jgi:hypothetical protein